MVDRLLDLDRALGEDLGHALGFGGGLRHLEQEQPVADAFGGVQHVVQPARQVVDVLALERRDERAVQPLEQLVRHEIALVLDVLEALGALFQLVEALHHLLQLLASSAHEPRLLPEQREEVFIPGEQREHGRPPNSGWE